MKKRIVRLSLCILIIVLVFLSSGNAAAHPNFPIYHSVDTYCSAGAAQRSWFADNTHHGRYAFYPSVNVWEDSELVFEASNYVNWNINSKTMKGLAWGTFEWYLPGSSDGYRGIWNSEMYIAWPLVIMAPQAEPLWLNEGKGVGQGTGSFQGLTIKLVYHQSVTVFDELPEGYPCVTGQTVDGQYFVLQQYTTGYIIGQSDD